MTPDTPGEPNRDWARSPAALAAAAILAIAGLSGLIHAWRSPALSETPTEYPSERETAAVVSSPAAVLIDPNTATADELALLPNIGPVLARRIVEDRDARGPYERPADLARVTGIGPKTVAAVRAHTTLEP